MSFGMDFCGGDGGIPIAAKDLSKIEAQPKHDIHGPASSSFGPTPGSSPFGPSQGRHLSPAMNPSGTPGTPGQGYRASPLDGDPAPGTPSMTPGMAARRTSFIASLFSLPGSATASHAPPVAGSQAHGHGPSPTGAFSSNPGPSGTPFSTPSDGLQSRSLFSSSSGAPSVSGASYPSSGSFSGSFSGVMAGQTPPVKPMAAPTGIPPAFLDERKTGRDF